MPQEIQPPVSPSPEHSAQRSLDQSTQSSLSSLTSAAAAA